MLTDSAYAGDSRHPQLPEPLRSAVLNHEDGRLEAAYPLYRRFVADHPRNPTGLQLFGLLLSQLGQHEPAITLLQESLKIFPAQPEVANNLGNALLRRYHVFFDLPGERLILEELSSPSAFPNTSSE